jgi:predicted DNA binding protein/DNA-binding NarL/FixJ family response regulator
MSREDSLQLLLIEDSPSDARLITEMLRDGEELTQRVLQDDNPAGSPEMHHETRLSAGLDYIESTHVDVVLLDLHLPDSTGIETLATVVEATDRTPIVVLTGLDDREIGIEAIQRGAQEYLAKDDVTDELLIRSIHHAIERKQQELARIEHEDRLETLNRLYTIVRDVSHIAIQTQSKEELEERVCQRLVESDAYRFAWIGEVKRESNHVVPRVTAGDEEYLDEITITIDGESTQGPTAGAIQTHEMHVVEDTFSDSTYEPWRDAADQHGFRSTVAIPLVYDEIFYGVLNVYSSQPAAFTDPGTDLLEHAGGIIGHAISAIEHKEALIGDSVNELEFRIGGVADPLVALSREHDGSVHATRVIQTDGDTILLYGSVTGLPIEEFRNVASGLEWVDHVRLMGPKYDRMFEIAMAKGVPFIDTLASYGGKFRSITITDEEFRVVAQLSHQNDTRRVLEAIQDVGSGAELLAQRKVSQPDEPVSVHQTIEDQFTEKQRIALETAYFAGFFDTPRASSGEEIAGSLDISAVTFFQHLRKAQKKLLAAFFGGDDSNG